MLQCLLVEERIFHLELKFMTPCRDFPGGPVVKTSPSGAEGVGSISGRGAKIPHALWPKNQNIKQKQYCNRFNKDFKNGPHQKILKKKKKAPCNAFFCGREFEHAHFIACRHATWWERCSEWGRGVEEPCGLGAHQHGPTNTFHVPALTFFYWFC